MAYTQEDLDLVQTAIVDLAVGKREKSIYLSTGDRVEYSEVTLDGLRALKGIIEADLSSTFHCRTYAKNGGRG